MMRFFCYAFVVSLLPMVCCAQAEDLQEVLRLSLENNPTIARVSFVVEALREERAQLFGATRPHVSWEGRIGVNERFGGSGRGPVRSSLVLEQSLYAGGRTRIALRALDRRIAAQEFRALAEEQDVLLETALAYLDVWRDRAVLDLQVHNEAVLEKELSAVRDRFVTGSVTETDVVQAESRVGSARAQRISASGDLRSSLARLEELSVVGELEVRAPSSLLFASVFPSGEEEAVSIAEGRHPLVLAALEEVLAAEADVEVSRRAHRLTAKLQGSLVFEDDHRVPDSVQSEQDEASAGLMAIFSFPLYAGGTLSGDVSRREAILSQRSEELSELRRRLRRGVRVLWARWRSSEALVRSWSAALVASELALEGVRAEQRLGERTILDVLNAEQERLFAHTNLLSARRDRWAFSYRFLASVGRFTADSLDIERSADSLAGRFADRADVFARAGSDVIESSGFDTDLGAGL